MATLSQWAAGARPRTLPAAIAPVVLGTAAAHLLGRADAALAILALVVALALQVGVNYANDYSDGIRGTDEARVGPVRLVGQRLADPRNVKVAAFLAFGARRARGPGARRPLARVAAAAPRRARRPRRLAVHRGERPVRLPRPRGGLRLRLLRPDGDPRHRSTPRPARSRGSASSARSAWAPSRRAILVANNLRDIPTDTLHGKQTLAVRLGDHRTRILYVVLVGVSLVVLLGMALSTPWALLGLLALPLGLRSVRTVLGDASGRDLVPVLAGTGLYEVVYAVLTALGVTVAVALR